MPRDENGVATHLFTFASDLQAGIHYTAERHDERFDDILDMLNDTLWIRGDGSGDLMSQLNLSDVDNVATARSNLGLGSFALANSLIDIGAAASNHIHTAAEVGAAAVNHTHTPADLGAADAAHTHNYGNMFGANNLSEIVSQATARDNIGAASQTEVSAKYGQGSQPEFGDLVTLTGAGPMIFFKDTGAPSLRGCAIANEDNSFYVVRLSDDQTQWEIAPGETRQPLRVNLNTGDTSMQGNLSAESYSVWSGGGSIEVIDDNGQIDWAHVKNAPAIAPVWTELNSVAMAGRGTQEYYNIPSTATEIIMAFDGISLNGSDNVLIQIGNSQGFISWDYKSASMWDEGKVTSDLGYIITLFGNSNNLSGEIKLNLFSGNVWSSSHGAIVNDFCVSGGGFKQITGTLDRIRLSKTGTNNFDGGTVYCKYR